MIKILLYCFKWLWIHAFVTIKSLGVFILDSRLRGNDSKRDANNVLSMPPPTPLMSSPRRRGSRSLKTLLLLIFTQLWIFTANADFGDSCTPPPISDSTGYLASSTAYGYLQKNIDMTTNISNGCTQDGQFLRFCIRNSIPSPVCQPVEMSLGDEVQLSSISSNPNIGSNPLLGDIKLKAELIENSLCLTMPTSRGVVPIVCRLYSSISNIPSVEGEVCKNLGASCYDGRTKSQSLLSFSGITVHCTRETLDKVFYVGNTCPAAEHDIEFTLLSPFPDFQIALKQAVTAALILYVMFYGFNLVMNNEYANLNKVSMFLLKFVFVVYFSIGFGWYYDSSGKQVSHNGVTETMLPFVLQMTSDFTKMIFLAGGSQGLCVYDPSKYQPGYEFYQVWDAIDCRIGYYLGMQLLYNIDASNIIGTGVTAANNTGNSIANFGSTGSNGLDALSDVGTLTFFAVMFGFFMSGNIIIVICGMIFCVVFVSVIFYFLSVYLVSMVTLYVMAYISPIFVPMLLFERTKSYFDSWVKIVVSCALQPAVVGGFIAMLLTMFDSIFYGNCEYLRHDYQVLDFNFSTFEIREPASEPEKCTNSIGYKLVKYYLGQGWETKSFIIFEVIKLSDFLNLGLSMVYLLAYIFIFYFVLQSINEFISDLTGGPSMGSVLISPTAFMDKAAAVAKSYMAGRLKDNNAYKAYRAVSGTRRAAPKVKEASDKLSKGSSEGASDKASGGGS